jgi:hypothetical protein
MKVLARIVLAVVSVSLLSSAPALADPPPSNKNIEPFTFDCTRGSESRDFVAIGIGQSAQIAGQIQGTNEVVRFVQINDHGVVVFDVPGLSSSDTVWTCTVLEAPDSVFKVLITPGG